MGFNILKYDDTYLIDIGFATDRTTYLNGDFCDIEHPEAYFEVDNDGDCGSNTWAASKHCDHGFGTGDIVGIELDTNNMNISFYINGKNQGITFKKIPRKKYYLAVTFRTVGNSIKIVDFVETLVSQKNNGTNKALIL